MRVYEGYTKNPRLLMIQSHLIHSHLYQWIISNQINEHSRSAKYKKQPEPPLIPPPKT